MQAWARLIRKRGFNMAGKENQWDLRVEYGWGRCARTRTNTQAHTYRLTQSGAHAFHTHTLGKKARALAHTHTQIIAIITLAHAQAIIYSNIQLHMQESTPGYNLSIA